MKECSGDLPLPTKGRTSFLSPAPLWHTPQGEPATKEYFSGIQRSVIEWWYENRRNDLPWRANSRPRNEENTLQKGYSTDWNEAPVSSRQLGSKVSLALFPKNKGKEKSIAQTKVEEENTVEVYPKIPRLSVPFSPARKAILSTDETSWKNTEELPSEVRHRCACGDRTTKEGEETHDGEMTSFSLFRASAIPSSITTEGGDAILSRHCVDDTTTDCRRITVLTDRPNPYAIWVSEVMSQQTQMSTVIKYFIAWMKKFPTIEALAAASEAEVRVVWAGMGYYRRALYLLHGARYVVKWWNDQRARGVAEGTPAQLPSTSKALQQVPGIGPYTAAAIASICHGEPTIAVDGNLVRVLCRLRGERHFNPKLPQNVKRAFQWGDQLMMCGEGKKEERNGERDSATVSCSDPGALNQGLMEIGARICKPNGSPQCASCPLRAYCGAYAACHVLCEIPAVEGYIPLKAPGTSKRVEHVVCVVHEFVPAEEMKDKCGGKEKGKQPRTQTIAKGSTTTLQCKNEGNQTNETNANNFRHGSCQMERKSQGTVASSGNQHRKSRRGIGTGNASFVVVRREEHGLLGGMLEFPSLPIPASVVKEVEEKEQKTANESREKDNALKSRKWRQETEEGRSSKSFFSGIQSKLVFEEGKFTCRKEDGSQESRTRGCIPFTRRKRERKEQSDSFGVLLGSPVEQGIECWKEEGMSSEVVSECSGHFGLPSLLSSPYVEEMVRSLAGTHWNEEKGESVTPEVANPVRDKERKGEETAVVERSMDTSVTTSSLCRIQDENVDYIGAIYHVFSHIHMTVYVYRRQWRIRKNASGAERVSHDSLQDRLAFSMPKISEGIADSVCRHLTHVLSSFSSGDVDGLRSGGKPMDQECVSANVPKTGHQSRLRRSVKAKVKEEEEVVDLQSLATSLSTSSPLLSSASPTDAALEKTRERISIIHESEIKSGACSRLMLKVFERFSEFSSLSLHQGRIQKQTEEI